MGSRATPEGGPYADATISPDRHSVVLPCSFALILAWPALSGDPGEAVCDATWQGGFGLVASPNQAITCLAEFDDGSGADLYAGGWFTEVGGVPAARIARFDGAGWSPLGSGLSGTNASDLAVFDDGTGPALYVAGSFFLAGGQPASNIARFDGETWTPLGAGTNLLVSCLEVFDDGTGPALYAGGAFTTAGGGTAARLARWSGETWTDVGGGLDSYPRDLHVHDDGSGPALYVAGDFFQAGAQPVSRIARWDGQTWSDVGGGFDDRAFALATFDDGSGPALFAGGLFQQAGGQTAARIARWDGAVWSEVSGGTDDWVTALTTHDDGSGPALYAGGWFTNAGGVTARHVARFDGSGWSPLTSGVDDTVTALAGLDVGPAQGLWLGGVFSNSPGAGAHLAHWACALPNAPEVVWGCLPKQASLLPVSSLAELAEPFTMSLSNPDAAPGLGLLYAGAPGEIVFGCGTNLGPLGELLLAPVPAPVLVAVGDLLAGDGTLSVTVPAKDSLVGAEIAFQAATLHLSTEGIELGLSGALEVTLGF